MKARLKFMVDDLGVDGMRTELERRVGYALPDFELSPPPPIHDHMGVFSEHGDGLVSLGVPMHVGLMSGTQMLAIADLAEELGGDVRVTRQQNFVLTRVPEEGLDGVVERLAATGFPLEGHPLRASAIACTGEPHCNFSVSETKTRLAALVEQLETPWCMAHGPPRRSVRHPESAAAGTPA